MSLQTNVRDGLQTIVLALNALKSNVGTLSSLSTTERTSTVAAINELKAEIQSVASSVGATINDAATTSTTQTWSVTKIAAEIQVAVDSLIDSAPGTLDTLNELAAAIQSNDGDLSGIITSLTKRVRVDGAQAFTALEKQQARDNIDVFSKDEIGDINFDFAAHVNSNLT